ncbi:winged helix-turn-helix transcriptional regulator [Candidatus Parcubacteria bacterium]|nr:winged helix-turn-helix transcriptional regulator [Candidatus Parcubacteria bacterium]
MKKRTAWKQTHAPQEIAHITSLFFAVRQIMRTTLAKDKKIDSSTWLRIETMKFIGMHDRSKMKDIADYLSITAPSATSLVSGLVESGLVMGRTDQHDRRASQLILTAKGKAELRKAIAHGLRLISPLFSVLSKAELAALTRALEKIKRESFS